MASANACLALAGFLLLCGETRMCASVRVTMDDLEAVKKTPVTWAMIESGRYCSKNVRKDLADVTSVEQCQQQTEEDPDCGTALYTDGTLCRCVKVGRYCDFPKSEVGTNVYESSLTDLRKLKIVKAGDPRVHGDIVVTGVHRGRPQYTLEDNPKDDCEIFWSNKKKKWRLVFDNTFGFSRSTVYWNAADQDLLPLTGWTVESMYAQPALEITVEGVEPAPTPAQPAVETAETPAPATQAPAPATEAPVPAPEAPAPATEAPAPATQAPAPATEAPAPAPVTQYVGLDDAEVADLKNGAAIAGADQIDSPTCEMLKTRGHGCKLHENKCRCKFVGPKPKTCDALFESEGTAYVAKGMRRYALFGKGGCECRKVGGFESQCDLTAMTSEGLQLH